MNEMGRVVRYLDKRTDRRMISLIRVIEDGIHFGIGKTNISFDFVNHLQNYLTTNSFGITFTKKKIGKLYIAQLEDGNCYNCVDSGMVYRYVWGTNSNEMYCIKRKSTNV